MKNKRTKFKAIALSLAAIATSLLVGAGTACSNNSSTDNTDEDKVVTKQDAQEIKNGNFEFYKDNDGLYPICSADNWSVGTSGNSSASMSGIINTRKDRWDYITDIALPKTLQDNNDLKSDDEAKKDYNGALTDDMLFVNPHEATKSEHEFVASDYIANPYTHKYSYNSEGQLVDLTGNVVTTYVNDDGEYFLDEDFKTPLETSVLMLHNYRSNYYTGTESYGKSSTTVSLEASTACKISLWVKTSNLYFDGAKNERTEVKSERGAYIKVGMSVGGNNVSEDFIIKNINTEQLNYGIENPENNGWVQYTLYVEASRFATTDITLTVGLGRDSVYTLEGYAFFDDIEFTKYTSDTELHAQESNFDSVIRYTDDANGKCNTCLPLDPDGTFEFRVDKETAKTNNSGSLTTWSDNHNFADRHFLINFANTADEILDLTTGVSAGLTVDADNYVSTKSDAFTTTSNITRVDNGDKVYIGKNLGADGLNVSKDIVGAFTINSSESWTFPCETYVEDLTENLHGAASLPGIAGNETSAIFILSAHGAAYEATITNAKFALAKDEYLLLSFWLKTSDMDGKTAATVRVIETTGGEDSDNSASFTLDSTTKSAVNIGDKEDIYDGWVQCFVRVSNVCDSDETKTFKLKFNFGNTVINNAAASTFKSGWAAIANMSLVNLTKDTYSYSSGVENAATLSITEDAKDTSHYFDTEKSAREQIKTDFATPNSYTGYYGASKNVNPDFKYEDKDFETEYVKPNNNSTSGLLNKDYLDAYKSCDWYNALLTAAGIATTETDTAKIWKAIAGEYVVQPLIIVNSVKQFNESESGKIYNYGYVGNNTTISADSYTAVSVNVKVSAGAIATVYLVDSSTSEVLSYDTPDYTFWYDDDGNVLKGKENEDWTKAEKKQNIAYTLREDGLYEDSEGNLYANLYNLTTHIDKYVAEHEEADFYKSDATATTVEEAMKKAKGVSFLNAIKDGSDSLCYANKDKTAYCTHFLIAGNTENNKVYKYCSGVGKDATYYYMEKGEPNTSKIVKPFDTSVATLRYDMSQSSVSPYKFTIDAIAHPEYADKWIRVTFYIHTGSATKEYRLELWSGTRDEQSSYTSTATSYVVFDYDSVSLDETIYNDTLKGYTNTIVTDYNTKITEELEENVTNLKELEKLAGSKSNAYTDFAYEYYTFSLYDSSAFIPFNGQTADEASSGYMYTYSKYDESLAYFAVNDTLDSNGIAKNYMQMSAFIDYSVIDKDIDIIGAPTASTNEETTDDKKDNTNAWLLAASIALVVAIFIAILAIFIKDFAKKHNRSAKSAGKNSYNFKKNKRYVKQYVKANGEAPEIAEGTLDKSLLEDKQEPADVVEESAEPAAEEVSEPEAQEDNATAEPENAEEATEAEDAPEATEPVEAPENEESAQPEEAKDDGEKPSDDDKKE